MRLRMEWIMKKLTPLPLILILLMSFMPIVDAETHDYGKNVIIYTVDLYDDSNDKNRDLLPDSDEINIYRTDPNKRDSDGDGWVDALEVKVGTAPNNPDTDGDGIIDSKDKNPLYGLKWSYHLEGANAAVPIDLESDGKMCGIVVAKTGEPGGLYALTSSSKLKWKHEFIPHRGYAIQHLAPIDYNSDGKFDEILVDIGGSTTKPGVIVFGPEAYTFNFYVISPEGEQLWYYQCGYLTGWGAKLKCPQCDAEDADRLYKEKIGEYGYKINTQFITENFNRIDLDGDGNFDDIIRLHTDSVKVYDNIAPWDYSSGELKKKTQNRNYRKNRQNQ